MRILFDQGTPAPLRHHFAGHEIFTAHEMGWSNLANGDLLFAAEQARFDLLITTDQNLEYQQNLKSRTIAILVLSTTSWPLIKLHAGLVVNAVARIKTGEYERVVVPR